MKTRSLYLFTVTLTLLFCAVALQSDGFTTPKRGWLGVSVREMTPSMRSEYELGDRFGLLITDVLPGSPADDAGLREDDVIIKYDGKQVERADAFSDLVRKTVPETRVQLTIVREISKWRSVANAVGGMAFSDGAEMDTTKFSL